MRLSWHTWDLKSGRIGGRLRVRGLGSAERIIGEPTSLTLEVACWDTDTQQAVPGWDSATLPGRSGVLLVDDDLGVPLWAGMVSRRRSTAGEWVSVDCDSLEAYLDRRYVGDHSFEGVSQGQIVVGILTADVLPDGVALAIDADSPKARVRHYDDDEDKTVLSVLQDLMGVIDGPEWTIEPRWADGSHMALLPTLVVRDRLGTPDPLPAATWWMPGPVTGVRYVESYTADQGANDVLAVSSGAGKARPESDHMVAQALLDGGWVRYEHRFTPSTSITQKDTLNEHAAETLAEMRDGLAELQLTARLTDGAPRPGVDFHLGDDVAVSLTCPRFPAQVDASGRKVAGYVRQTRCIGWRVDADELTVEPRLLEVNP